MCGIGGLSEDFIAEYHNIVPFCHPCDSFQILFVKDAARWIVRIAEHQQTILWIGHLCLQIS